MFQWSVYDMVQADRQRQVAWAEKHAWEMDVLAQERRRQRRARVARLLWALAARLTPVDAEPVGEHGQLAVERGA